MREITQLLKEFEEVTNLKEKNRYGVLGNNGPHSTYKVEDGEATDAAVIEMIKLMFYFIF